MKGFVSVLTALVARHGIRSSSARLLRILQKEGIGGIRSRFRFVKRRLQKAPRELEAVNPLSVVPVYLKAITSKNVSLQSLLGLKIGVHLHLCHPEMLPELAGYLNRIPLAFDLFVSIPEGSDKDITSSNFKERIAQVAMVRVASVPNRGRDISPLIIEFGADLIKYDVIGHFHTTRTPHNNYLSNWRRDVLDLLIGDESGAQIAALFDLLRSGAKVVFPEGQDYDIKDKSGWSANRALATQLLNAHTPFSIENFQEVEFPEEFMFWAKAKCLREFLQLPLKYNDFPSEPIPADGTLTHALERVILIFASMHPGHCVRLHNNDSIKDYRFYEEQEDCSRRLKHKSVRVLSYYLPQFHPIPENDRWHGPGFTEWDKVRAATPLFLGHYQQHIPHDDIGYYLLDSAQVLRRQADMMRKAGVYGQVFYHYWFSGKLILERPAQMLLENAHIDMPFCFCWANENWTRRWDGEENDILMKQDYPADDARAFIRYLLPFFQDERYIKIDGRPLLFVYRPADIPNVAEHLETWAAECQANGSSKPFVTAVLTRGAENPKDFGMDAGVERVLHDWAGGHVADILTDLVPYQSLEATRVMSYPEVAKYYWLSKDRKVPFTYFRSLVPNWDNSARYGSAGHLLHGSTPQSFQDWLEAAIEYTEATLAQGRQFILINAWNEWAEGAHLEPDSRFGYAYLNSVGRALSGVSYRDTLNSSAAVPVSERILIRLTEALAAKLRSNKELLEAFRSCLAKTSILEHLVAELGAARLLGIPETKPDVEPSIRFELEFSRPVLFDNLTIEKMAQLACATKTSVVLANAYGHSHDLVQITANGSTPSYSAYGAPMMLLPLEVGRDGRRNFRVRTDAHCFVSGRDTDDGLPEVTTIVRFHADGDSKILKRALFCLAAMKGCNVTPLVAAQDLTRQQANALEMLVHDIPWAPRVRPTIQHYASVNARDLRSLMLNKSLLDVQTRYAAFLDFDDLLMPHAYEWLLGRLQTTTKAVAIGRVFETLYDPKSEMLVERNRHYQYGYSYDDFIAVNIAPLHSFMIDLSQLEIANLKFFEDQRFLEDYLLLLQLVTRENTDWEGLGQDVYIGDYVRFRDNRNTLAIADPQRGEGIRKSSDYLLCESRIRDLKMSLKH